MLTYVGVTLLAALILHLVVAFRRLPPRRPWPRTAAIGLALIGIGHVAQAYQLEPIYLHLTPWMWTGFILLVDAVNYRVAGNSLILSRPIAFWVQLPLSILFWVAFEIYNLKLQNWIYVGLPANPVHRYLAYGWAFATILPAIFQAAELYFNLVFNRRGLHAPMSLGKRWRTVSLVIGFLFLMLPLLVGGDLAPYLFGLVWMGVVLALDPINYRLGLRSLWRDLEQGDWRAMASLWWGGALCGFLWEFWNYWAEAKWVYIFPILQNAKIFEMPFLGYLGFPFFALECYVFCELVLGRSLPGFVRLESNAGDQR